MTLDNQSAHIELTEQIPYQQQTTSTQSSSAVSTTAFKDSGIKLDVTPHITTKDNYISMNLKVEQSFLSGYTPDSQPIIDSRKAETNLLVRNGETIVIGGLRKKEDTVTIDKVPFLGDIPFLGLMFRKKTKSVSDIDLLIFVTPRVISEAVLTEKDKERLELFNPSDENKEEKKIDFFEGKKPEKKEDLKKEEVFTLRPPS
jgi:type II secretory pathway component GspD/PulD (secretin)